MFICTSILICICIHKHTHTHTHTHTHAHTHTHKIHTSEEEIASWIGKAVGPSGTNREVILNLQPELKHAVTKAMGRKVQVWLRRGGVCAVDELTALLSIHLFMCVCVSVCCRPPYCSSLYVCVYVCMLSTCLLLLSLSPLLPES